MNTQPVILLNIEETVTVLDGLVLYALADGNEGSRKVENYESCMKFQVMATNVNTGERTRQKYALHGRLVARKGVGVDHQFVLEKIIEAVKDHLDKGGMIISNDAAPGVFMTRAIWRYIFAAGTRVSNFPNGVGIFSQPVETNFIIGKDPIEKLQAAAGSFTLAIANDELVKFYLGEEFPMWGAASEDPEDKVWTPCKKKLAPVNVNECLKHFVTHISQVNNVLEVYPAERMDDLLKFVASTLDNDEDKVGPRVVEVVEAPADDTVSGVGGFLRRLIPAAFSDSAKHN